MKPGNLITLSPGSYLRVHENSDSANSDGPFVCINDSTKGVLVEPQGFDANSVACWLVLANDELLIAWQDNMGKI